MEVFFNQPKVIRNTLKPFVFRYIVSKNAETREVHICFSDNENHPSLFVDNFFTGPPHWIGGRDTPGRVAEKQKRSPIYGFAVIILCFLRLRYRRQIIFMVMPSIIIYGINNLLFKHSVIIALKIQVLYLKSKL